MRKGKSTITTTDSLPSLPRTVHHGARSTESTEGSFSMPPVLCRRHADRRQSQRQSTVLWSQLRLRTWSAASRRTIAPYSLQRRRRRLTRYLVTAYPYTTLATSAHGHCYILSRPLVSSTAPYLARHQPLRDKHFLYHLLCKVPPPARRRQ